MADPDYFTLVELEELPDMTDAQYTDARKLAAAAYITAIIERVCQTSFIHRTITDEVHDGGCAIWLNRPYVRSVTSATENGAAITDDLRASAAGELQRFSSATSFYPLPWLPGVGNVAVTYVAGYSSEVPADLKDAAMQATRWRLIATNSNTDMNARQMSISNEQGVVQFAVAGQERPTGYPDVDAVIIGWRNQVRLVPC